MLAIVKNLDINDATPKMQNVIKLHAMQHCKEYDRFDRSIEHKYAYNALDTCMWLI